MTAAQNPPALPNSAEDYFPVKAPRGTERSARTWAAEAAKRMLLNNLDEEVGEDPRNLVVYGGSGRAARSWKELQAIVASLEKLAPDETLLVQSGRPVGVFRTHEWAPRVLIANSHLVPAWATWEEFRRLEAEGLTMFGQMTAGSWIYIGTQGILQGTYETFAAIGTKHFEGTLAGRLIVTAGLGGMGGAQPLAATMNGAAILGIDVDQSRIEKRLQTGYLDQAETDLDKALEAVEAARREGRALSVGLLGNAGDVLPELVKRGIKPDVVTDQTSAHDMLNGYVPNGMTFEAAMRLRSEDPAEYERRSFATVAIHVQAMLDLQQAGSVVVDYGNNIRGQAQKAGVENAFDFPGFVPAYIRPLFCEGKGPFRWAALSGDPADIHATDQAVLDTFPEDEALCRWIRLAADQIHFQGLPSRICWLGYGERARLGLVMNELVRSGKVSAPIVIGRDHLDSGSVASPYRETEGMKDGSDAIADWPLLNGLLNTSSGASWVSIHHGGGVGIGNAIHAGVVIVADGTDDAAKKLERVLTNDPGTGVMRHADAGYEEAVRCAQERGVQLPMQDSR